MMPRRILVPLLAVAFVVAPAATEFVPATGLSGSAQAQKTPTTNSINLNSSRSNIYREGSTAQNANPSSPTRPKKSGKARMGGGGGQAR
jgi:hypothetical protein